MKKINIIIASFVLLTVPTLFAQSNSVTAIKVSKDISSKQVTLSKKEDITPESIAKKQTNKMAKDLGLSKQQTIKVKDLNLKVQQKIEVVATGRMTEEKKQEFTQGILKDRLNALSTILTKEQFSKYTSSLEK